MNTSYVDAFIELMGVISQTDGAPRIAGRIFGLLLVEGRPFALDEMAQRLSISKASASTNARLLLHTGMIRQTSKPGDRRDYYELGQKPYSRMIETISTRMRRSAAQVLETEALFPDSAGPAKRRVRQLADFYSGSADFFANWASHFDEQADNSDGAQP